MSELNILNPSASSVLNPTYSIPHKDPQIAASWQPRSGKPYSRDLMARGMTFDLHWEKVQFSTYLTLRQWFRQYEKGFFSYCDYDDNSRYYSGQFMAEPQYERIGNNQVNISATFVGLPTVASNTYPSNWGVDSIFIYPQNDFGQDNVKYTGTWSIDQTNANAKSGIWSFSATTNDIAEIIYFGFGFRYWSAKASNLGIVEISLDGTVLGTVDLYAAAPAASAALFTQQNVKLGQHRVKLRCTGTKNAGSSAFNVTYDTIEVMR